MVWDYKKSLTKTSVIPKGLPKREAVKPPAHLASNAGGLNKAVPYKERLYTPQEVIRKPIEKAPHDKATMLIGIDDDEAKKKEEEDTSAKTDPLDEPQKKSYEINVGSTQVKGLMAMIQEIIKQLFGS